MLRYTSCSTTSVDDDGVGKMPALIASIPEPKFAPAVIGSLGRAVGAVKGVNDPGRTVGVVCCGADTGD